METTVTHMTTAQNLNQALIEVIETTRQKQKMSQRALAETAGIPLASLHSKIKGRRLFNAVELGLVAEALGTTLTELAIHAERLAATGGESGHPERAAS